LITKLINSWINLQSLEQSSKEADQLMWAAEEVNLLSISSPRECWEFILDVIQHTDDEWVLTNLAAGPLENLLSVNPEEVILWIEKEVGNNPKLKQQLGSIWKNIIPDHIWKRFEKIM